MDKEKKTMLGDAKDVKDGVKKAGQGVADAAKATDTFFKDGTSKVLGPAATKALLQGKKLLEKVSDRLFKRDDE